MVLARFRGALGADLLEQLGDGAGPKPTVRFHRLGGVAVVAERLHGGRDARLPVRGQALMDDAPGLVLHLEQVSIV